MDPAFVDKLAGQNTGAKYLLVAVDNFFEICQSSNNEKKYAKDTLQAFKKHS